MKKKRAHQIKILKATGHMEPFSKKKLLTSIERTGLPSRQCNSIANDVAKNVCEGLQTKDIFDKTLSLIKKASPVATVNYSLKRSLFDLGPEGHHFEQYVAKYFERIGYETQTCKTLRGKYVFHEVDVIATTPDETIFSECKFHNHAGRKNDIKVSLYVKARWDDLKHGPDGKDLDSFYIVSNTAFTQDAITYANGTGLKLLGVNAPHTISFLDEIKRMKLYPLTSLKQISKSVKKQLLLRNVFLAEEVPHHVHLLQKLGVTSHQFHRITSEIEQLLGKQK